ncbi:MAG: hypothetical protein ACP5K2_02160 [bacterium]
MGICKFCGKPAGFLRKEHKECKEKHNQGVFLVTSMIAFSLTSNVEKDEILKIANDSFINETELKDIILNAWEKALDNALMDKVITEDEENRLKDILFKFGFSIEELSSKPSYLKLVKTLILRDILEGKIPNRVKIDGPFPFNLLKGETVIWIFSNVNYYQTRTYRHYTGSSQGVSIRVMKGVYYRVGGFKGYPIEESKLTLIDQGILCITNENIYFGGKLKSFRIPYNKIVSFTPYSDGIGIHRDSANSKPEFFLTDDGWFTYNLLVNLANKL